jgi:hypothetical protein
MKILAQKVAKGKLEEYLQLRHEIQSCERGMNVVFTITSPCRHYSELTSKREIV